MNRYYPRRPVRSFQDLEVYQKTYGLAVEIVKKLLDASEVDSVMGYLRKVVLRIPRLIAAAHSVRFGRPQQAVDNLEKVMLDCNLAVYYLSLARDLGQTKIKLDYFEEQIKEYLRVRGKIMRLQRAWLKFMEVKNVE